MTPRLLPSLALFVVLAVAVSPVRASGIDVPFFTKLRLDYAHRKDFNYAWNAGPEREKIIAAFHARDFPACRSLAETWLKTVPVDAEIWLVQALACKMTRDLPAYTRTMASYYGLLSSIVAEGDGLSEKTAFKVIAVPEEYELIRDVGAKVKRQALIGHCDRMDLELDGQEITWWFDVSISLEAERREFGLK